MVGHLTREYSRIAWYFLARGGSISVEASSHRQHCKQLCGGMEIPCWVTFTCSRKATLNWLKLKALLKVVIYANLQHGVQMFSQISCIPDLIQKFWAKKCGLYADGVYGKSRIRILKTHFYYSSCFVEYLLYPIACCLPHLRNSVYNDSSFQSLRHTSQHYSLFFKSVVTVFL